MDKMESSLRRLGIGYSQQKKTVKELRKQLSKEQLKTEEVQEKLDTAMKSLQLAHDRIEKLERLVGGSHE